MGHDCTSSGVIVRIRPGGGASRHSCRSGSISKTNMHWEPLLDRGVMMSVPQPRHNLRGCWLPARLPSRAQPPVGSHFRAHVSPQPPSWLLAGLLQRSFSLSGRAHETFQGSRLRPHIRPTLKAKPRQRKVLYRSCMVCPCPHKMAAPTCRCIVLLRLCSGH
jgi:hypothetical protein